MTAPGEGAPRGEGSPGGGLGAAGADPVDPVDEAFHGFEVLAGGGVVWRPGVDGLGVEVLVVHRPRYDDWTLPKGKLDPGESLEACARREVAEETGLACRLGEVVADVTYVDHKGRRKLVRYWAMTVDGGSFTPNDEVDEVRWLAVPEARSLLTYRHDTFVLDRFLEPA